MKAKRCKICRLDFMTTRPLAVVCSLICAVELSKQKSVKKARNELTAGRIKLKSITDHLNDAQAVFNKWIRLRDGNFCISCQKPVKGQTHAGHYRTTKAASQLRFNEDNVHSQCATCNNHLSGNITEYRINLVRKIGTDRVSMLENNNTSHRYTIEGANNIKAHYKAKLKALER